MPPLEEWKKVFIGNKALWIKSGKYQAEGGGQASSSSVCRCALLLFSFLLSTLCEKAGFKTRYHETDQKDIKLRHFKHLTIVRGTWEFCPRTYTSRMASSEGEQKWPHPNTLSKSVSGQVLWCSANCVFQVSNRPMVTAVDTSTVLLTVIKMPSSLHPFLPSPSVDAQPGARRENLASQRGVKE